MALQGNVNEVEYLSGFVASVPAGFIPGGTTDHSQLSNRDAADQHPIESIKGLRKKLDDLETGSSGIHVGTDEPTDENVVVWINPEAEDTSILVEAPAAAEVGQTIVVKSVNENGEPVAWETADLPDSYSKPEIDAIMGAYINDIDALIGGDS